MLIQSNRMFTPKKQSFGAKLIIQEPMKKRLEQDIAQFYNNTPPIRRKNFFGESPLNPEKLLQDLKTTFEKKTSKINMAVELIPSENKSYAADVQCLNGQDLYRYNSAIFNGSELLPDALLDKGNPYKKAIRNLIGCTANTTSKSKGANPLKKACNDLHQEMYKA